MNIRDIVSNNVSGTTFISLDTITPVKLTGGKSNPFQGRVTKQVIGSNVMVFQNKEIHGYEAMVHRRLISEGKDPANFQVGPRQWGEREHNTPFVTHNGNTYLEVIFLSAGAVQVLVDGAPYNGEIPGYPTSKQEGEQGGLDNKVIIRTYNVTNIQSIVINHQRYQQVNTDDFINVTPYAEAA